MLDSFARASKSALTLASFLGLAAGAAISFGGASQAQTPALVNPPGVSISAQPLQTDPSKWVGCHHITNGPNGQSGMLCAPSIPTGTPAIQETLRAQQAAYRAANPAPAGGGGAAAPPPPMVCGTPAPAGAN